MTHTTPILVLATGFFLAGCKDGLQMPPGDPEAGRQVFSRMQCYTCHRVAGEKFPPPSATPPVPVVLGVTADKKSREYLAESILAPSHRFARPLPTLQYGDAELALPREYENIRQGELSRMGDFTEVLRVRELIDLVAYLEFLQERKPELR